MPRTSCRKRSLVASTQPGWMTVTEKRSYLYRSVYNKAAEFHRTSRRRRSRETLAAQPELFEGPELRPEVLTAVFTLSIQQRAVIVLTYWDDLTPSLSRRSWTSAKVL